jgi:TRAP-type mannitol/chloroaromatic compound transport system substrate-binding protein
MKSILKTLLCLVSALALWATSNPAVAAGAGTPEDPIVWRMGGLYSRGISYGRTYNDFAENVKRLSGGRMIIEVYYDGEGFSASDLLNAVRTGLLEMANPFQALHAGEFPAGIVELGLPDGPEDLLEIRAMFREGGWLEAMREAYASIGIYYLGEAPNPGTFLLTKTPVNSLADLAKMKIRAPGAYGQKLTNLGASTVTMALSEVYSSLASGLLDGVDGCTILDHFDIKSFEMAKYIYKLPVANSQVIGLIANLEAFNALPDDLKAILEGATEMYSNDVMEKSVIWERDALNQMLAAGLQWSPDPSPEDVKKWHEGGRKIWEEYAKTDEFCKKLLDLQTAFMKSLGYDF